MRALLFICHASEDKDAVAHPLASKLEDKGYRVWFDEYSLKLGDSLRRGIEKGLSECDFGIVIISKHFFAKEWPQRELDSLTAREIVQRRKVILPIWHGVDASFIARFSPNLADKLAISTDKGIDAVINAINKVVEDLDLRSHLWTAEDMDRAELLYLKGLADANNKMDE